MPKTKNIENSAEKAVVPSKKRVLSAASQGRDSLKKDKLLIERQVFNQSIVHAFIGKPFECKSDLDFVITCDETDKLAFFYKGQVLNGKMHGYGEIYVMFLGSPDVSRFWKGNIIDGALQENRIKSDIFADVNMSKFSSFIYQNASNLNFDFDVNSASAKELETIKGLLAQTKTICQKDIPKSAMIFSKTKGPSFKTLLESTGSAELDRNATPENEKSAKRLCSTATPTSEQKRIKM